MTHQLQISGGKKNFHFEAQPKRSTHIMSIMYAELYFNCGQMVNNSERGAE